MNVLILDDSRQQREILKRKIKNLSPSSAVVNIYQETAAKPVITKILAKKFPKFHVALLDEKLSDGRGVEVGKAIIDQFPDVTLVLITAYADDEGIVSRAKENGFLHILGKPADEKILKVVLESALFKESRLSDRDAQNDNLRQILQQLFKQVPNDFNNRSLQHIIGIDPIWDIIKFFIHKYSLSDDTILIVGESGTGKELIARAIHDANPNKKSNPYISVNCAALPGELIESLLFGHEKGAFTGATNKQKGYFVEAKGGTIFLDEIGDMSLSGQAKLLRALQEKKVVPIGSYKEQDIGDVRVICATNKDLLKEMESDKFRKDLYFRISGLFPEIPPLRSRTVDIAPLIDRFQGSIQLFAEESVGALSTEYEWPGNVRELERFVSQVATIWGLDKPMELAATRDFLELWKTKHVNENSFRHWNSRSEIEDQIFEREIYQKARAGLNELEGIIKIAEIESEGRVTQKQILNVYNREKQENAKNHNNLYKYFSAQALDCLVRSGNEGKWPKLRARYSKFIENRLNEIPRKSDR